MSAAMTKKGFTAAGIVLAVGVGLMTIFGAWRELGVESPDPWQIAGRVLAGAAILLGAVLAALLVRNASGRPGAGPLALFLAALPIATGAEYYSDLLGSGVIESSLDAAGWVAFMVAIGALVTFSLEFPRPLRPEDLEAGSAGPVRSLRALMFRVRSRLFPLLAVTGMAVVALALIEASERAYQAVHPWEVFLLGLPAMGVLYLLLFGALANLKLSYRLSDPASRRSVFWILEGVLLVCLAFVFYFFAGVYMGFSGSHLPEILNVGAPVLFMTALLCFAFALLYRGGIDPELLVRRTTVYGITGVLLTGVFATAQFLAERVLSGGGGGAAWVTSVVVALLLSPLYRRAERTVASLLAPDEEGGRTEIREAAIDPGEHR